MAVSQTVTPSGWGNRQVLHGLLQLFWMAGAMLIYMVLAEMGSWTAAPIDNGSFYTVWPAAGFALAVVTRWGYRYLVAVAAGAFVWALGLGGLTLHIALALTVASTLGALVGALIIRQLLHGNYSLENIRHLSLFFAAGPFLAGLVNASLGTAWVLSDGDFAWSQYQIMWASWWFSSATGILLLAPLFLVWGSRTEINWSNRQTFEVALWLVALTFVSLVIFNNWLPSDTLGYPLELALFPIMAWGAIRFGQRGATSGVTILAIMAIWPLAQVAGGSRQWSQSPTLLWLFVDVATGTAYFLASIITEVRNREKQTALNEARLRAFIEALPDMAYVITREGRYLDVYAPAKATLHRNAQAMEGQLLEDCWSTSIARQFHAVVAQCLDSDTLQQLEYSIESEGETFWFEGRIAPMSDETGQRDRVIWVAYEITERKRAEAALRHRDELLEAVAEANRTLLGSSTLDAGIQAAIRTLGERAQMDRVNIYKNGHDGESGSPAGFLEYTWSAQGIAPFVVKRDSPVVNWRDEGREIYRNLANNEILAGVRNDFSGAIRHCISERGAHSILFAPIWVENYFWGAIGFDDCQRERIWEESDRSTIKVAAASIGTFILNKQGEADLRKAKETADNANAAKSEFLAMMSHEIRTPMNAILGFTDLLAQSQLDVSQQEHLSIIGRSGKSLLELINNILDFSKIESRGIELEYVPFNLEMTIIEVLELVMVRAREKGLKVDYKLHGAQARNFVGDPTRLRQILLNLANNAVKFTHEGGISIGVRVEPTRQSDHFQLFFEVTDTGIGIEAGKIGRLFQAFSQADSSTTRRFGGTGLGLVICKRLVERMDGTIGVRSEAGKGSTFYFDILAVEAPDAVLPTRPLGAERLTKDFAAEYPLSILVVEDDPVNQQLDREILHRLGYEATIVGDGTGALECLGEHPYDLVLMDVELPGKSGLEIIRQIRAGQLEGVSHELYTVALTAYAMEEDKRRCLDAGASEFLPKPIDISQLKSCMMQAYEHKRASASQ